jgi:hypothetical protein
LENVKISIHDENYFVRTTNYVSGQDDNELTLTPLGSGNFKSLPPNPL